MRTLEEILKIFPLGLRGILQALPLDFAELQEIRLRAGKPLLLQYQGREVFGGREGELTGEAGRAYEVSMREIRETLEHVGRHSLYAFEEEMRQGFLTITGGHRIGLAGRTVLEGNQVRSLKNISFLNVRLSHEVKGCADPVLPFLYREDGQVCHTLILSPPRCGKTTLLRDLIRQISNGSPPEEGQPSRPGHTVGVVDERSEIGGCYLGIPSNDLGIRTDVLDCCPKTQGMMMLIRSMSPEVVAVDEIGGYEEIHAIEAVLHCGCRLLATVHGSSMADLLGKPLLKKLVQDQVFERYVILHRPGGGSWVRQILDQQGNPMAGGNLC